MEYIYMAMFLQEAGKEISEVNMRKVFDALDLEFDKAKIQFFIPALSILVNANSKKARSPAGTSSYQQLSSLQKRFEAFERSIAEIDQRLMKKRQEQTIDSEDGIKTDKKLCEAAHHEEKPDNKLCEVSNHEEKPEVIETAIHKEIDLHEKLVHDLPARYVYAVADKGVEVCLEKKGLDGAIVYTMPYKEMCVVVHDCLAEPYKSDDEEKVKEWLFTQQEVLDAIMEKFGVVLPMSFDMIIEEKNGQDSDQMVIEWLAKNYDDFAEKISKLRDRQEYGVQVMLDTGILSKKLIETDEKLKKKKEEIDAKPEGIAYMERELLKELLKDRIEEAADQYFREFFAMIKNCSDDIVVGKVKKVGGNNQMLMNLSCLVKKDMVEKLGEELEKIQNQNGISVRFSGPWAPYSFVTPEKGAAKNG